MSENKHVLWERESILSNRKSNFAHLPVNLNPLVIRDNFHTLFKDGYSDKDWSKFAIVLSASSGLWKNENLHKEISKLTNIDKMLIKNNAAYCFKRDIKVLNRFVFSLIDEFVFANASYLTKDVGFLSVKLAKGFDNWTDLLEHYIPQLIADFLQSDYQRCYYMKDIFIAVYQDEDLNFDMIHLSGDDNGYKRLYQVFYSTSYEIMKALKNRKPISNSFNSYHRKISITLNKEKIFL